MQELLIATSNPGKLAEYQEYLKDLPFKLVSLKDLKLSSIEETGKTFEENAILKAKTYHGQSGLPCVADDGGLEIDALDGAPGVLSRRWKTGDEDVTDAELVGYTLERMENIPEGKRTARLRLVMAFADNGGGIHTTEASVEGSIVEKETKHAPGFPYRALLKVSKFGKMYDDLTHEEHKQVNHRVQAIKKLKPIIENSLT